MRVRGRPSGLKAAAHRLPAAAPAGPALTPETTAAPPAGNTGRPWACPARAAARPVSPYPARKQTPGTRDELAFDIQKRKRNYKNPLTGSVHASRGLPLWPDRVSALCLRLPAGGSSGSGAWPVDGAGGGGKSADAGVLVHGPPDQPDRQGRQVADWDLHEVWAGGQRYACRSGVNDLSPCHRRDHVLVILPGVGAPDRPAGRGERWHDRVVYLRWKVRRVLVDFLVTEVLHRH